MRFYSFILRNVIRRPVRSLLTGIGIALAVGAVVSLLGMARGFEQSFAELYEGRQVDLMVVRAGVTERLTSSIDQKIEEQIRMIPGVRDVTGGLMDVVSFLEADLIGVPIQGWEPGGFLFENLVMLEGRPLEPGDHRAVMLGTVLAENLGAKVGETIDIQEERFRVVGIYRSFNIFENGSAVVLLSDLQHLMARPGQVTGFQVVVRDVPEKKPLIDEVSRRIESLTNSRGESLKLSALPTRDFVKSTFQIRLAHAMAWVTSTIALVIGAVGMLNTMIMSVFERTHEIGILRAIGWRRWRIVRMILGESLVLALAGAVAGTAGAMALTWLLSTLPAASGYMRATIPGTVILEGFLIAIAIGLLGGFYPAYRGAGLQPTEAIRHD